MQGFIPAHSIGVIPLSARVWGWLAGSTLAWASLDPGPGGDFSWVGRDRGPAEDFIATPAMNLIAGEEYTLSFQYQGPMRLDLRDVLLLDRTLPPLATTPTGTGTRNVTFTAQQSGVQHILFAAADNVGGYTWCMVDNVSAVRTVRPAIHLQSPAEGFVMAEGNPLTISGSAFNFSAELDNVKV
ncbi:hypothetical protein RZS08_17850, partial [Arthrospira platensis SPKY1]|nr:hypothetical protein [Arthrospira platensis SPKY1]